MANWSNRTWTLAVADMTGAATIRATGKKNEFRLDPVRVNGKLLAYTVQFDGDEMTVFWKDVILFPRGTAAPGLPAGETPLPTFKPAHTGDYKSIAAQVIAAARPITERLEGDMIVRGNAEALTLYQVPAGIADGGELLVVTLRETVQGQGVSLQDGNGAGF